MEDYKGYWISKNRYNYGNLESVSFLFHNLNDCDETIRTGSSIENCKEQIDELVNN